MPKNQFQETNEILFFKTNSVKPNQEKDGLSNNIRLSNNMMPRSASNVQFCRSAEKSNAQSQNETTKNNSDDFQAYKYIEKAITSSTLHRIGSVCYNESFFLRILLGVAFVASAVYCVYSIVMVSINYLQFSVLTVSSINYEIPAEFPGKL
jgi:hypothetical protein